MRRRRMPILGALALALVLAWSVWTGVLQAPGPGPGQAAARSDPAPAVTPTPVDATTLLQSGDSVPGDPAATTRDPRSAAPGPASAPDPLLQSGTPPAEALQLLTWCGELTRPEPMMDFERNWLWLGEEAARVERSRYAQARTWMSERCGPWTLAPGSERAQALRAELIRRAAQSADVRDQLRVLEAASSEPSDTDAIAARRQLEAALASGRPELLRDIGRVLERSRYASPGLLGPYAGGGASSLFTLLACDLGMPCGADSEPVRLNCALRGVCGYADYETLLFDAWHGARAAQILQQHRALLLQRIRAGQIQGLFDPVPLPPKP